jgi:hypothetical protein
MTASSLDSSFYVTTALRLGKQAAGAASQAC